MTVHSDWNDFKESVRDAYTNRWDEIFNYCGISPKRKDIAGYVYYDASHICHKENTPSVQEYPQSLYCHACNESFDIFKVCLEVTGKDFATILKELGSAKGISFEAPKKEGEYNKSKKNTQKYIAFNSEKVQLVFAVFMRLAHHLMFEAKSGASFRDYATKRSLKLDFIKDLKFTLGNKNAINGVGCLPSGDNISEEMKNSMWNMIQSVENSGINSIEELNDVLKASQLVTAKGEFRLTGRMVFAVVLQGKVVNVYGRLIDNEPNPKPYNSEPHFYLPIDNAGFYNYDVARKGSYVIFAECIIDAVSLMQYGLNAISTFGVGGWKPDICIRLLSNTYKMKMMYLMFDKDKISCIESMSDYRRVEEMLKFMGPAGMKNAIKVGRQIEDQTGMTVRICNLPYDTREGIDGKNDINNIVKMLAPTKTDEEIKAYFEQILMEAQDVDTSELLVKLEIMDKNSRFYNEQDRVTAILTLLQGLHVLNAHRVIDVVSKKYNIPFELLFRYQMFNNTK